MGITGLPEPPPRPAAFLTLHLTVRDMLWKTWWHQPHPTSHWRRTIAVVPAVGTSPIASQGVLSFPLLGVNKAARSCRCFDNLHPNVSSWIPPRTCSFGEAAPRRQRMGQEAAVLLSCAPELCCPSLGWLKRKQSEERFSSRGRLYVRVNSGCMHTRYAHICIHGSLKCITCCAVGKKNHSGVQVGFAGTTYYQI